MLFFKLKCRQYRQATRCNQPSGLDACSPVSSNTTAQLRRPGCHTFACCGNRPTSTSWSELVYKFGSSHWIYLTWFEEDWESKSRHEYSKWHFPASWTWVSLAHMHLEYSRITHRTRVWPGGPYPRAELATHWFHHPSARGFPCHNNSDVLRILLSGVSSRVYVSYKIPRPHGAYTHTSIRIY